MILKILKKLLYVAVPFVLILVAFNISIWAGLASIVLLILALCYYQLPNLYKLKASMSYSTKDLSKSIRWMEKAHKTGRGAKTTSVSYAYLLLKNGEVEKSERIFNELLKSDKLTQDDKNIINSNISLIRWKQGNLDEAIRILENVFAEFKTSNIYGSLGYLYVEKGDMEKALEFNLAAYEYNSANSIILDNLGETYYNIGNFEEAEKIFKELIVKKPQFPEAYYHYALVLEALDRKEDALEMAIKSKEFSTSYLSAVTLAQLEEKIDMLKNGLNRISGTLEN